MQEYINLFSDFPFGAGSISVLRSGCSRVLPPEALLDDGIFSLDTFPSLVGCHWSTPRYVGFPESNCGHFNSSNVKSSPEILLHSS